MEQTIEFGDFVVIDGTQNDNKNSAKGLVSATGYCNNDIYLEQIDPKLYDKKTK